MHVPAQSHQVPPSFPTISSAGLFSVPLWRLKDTKFLSLYYWPYWYIISSFNALLQTVVLGKILGKLLQLKQRLCLWCLFSVWNSVFHIILGPSGVASQKEKTHTKGVSQSVNQTGFCPCELCFTKAPLWGPNEYCYKWVTNCTARPYKLEEEYIKVLYKNTCYMMCFALTQKLQVKVDAADGIKQ